MRFVILLAACAALAAPAEPPPAEPRPAPRERIRPMANTVVGTTRDGRICKQILRTGSRLGEARVCKTREEWDAYTQDARKAIERKQIFSTN